MTTMTLEPSDQNGAHVEARTSASFDRSPLPRSPQFSDAVYPSLAAINTTWAGFINRRLKENLTLPVRIPGKADSVSDRFRTAIRLKPDSDPRQSGQQSD